MSAIARLVIDAENPWPGLGSFDESAERFFNGRRDEAAALRRLVVQSPLTVLFAASGLGKTSLLQAGLFPVLRKEHFLPVYIRLDVRDRGARLIDQVTAALRKQIEGWSVEAKGMAADESLWAYLHRRDLELWSRQNHLLTPVFVFDQFEEVFTLGAENIEGIARLRVDLADLIENRMPTDLARRVVQHERAAEGLSLDSQRYKVVLSFREDFLPAVEGWKRDIPSILRNRLRLLPMSGEQAFQAVYETGKPLVDEPLARDIVRFVAAAQDDRQAGVSASDELGDLAVEPALLSVVCHGLNEKRKAQQKQAFDAALLTGTGQAVIFDYYRTAVAGMPPNVHRFLENELITERGFRKACAIDDARSVHGVSDQQLRLLVDRRLLRIEPQRGTEHVELTHDLLTRVVREHRDKQREKTRRRRMAAFAAMGIAFAGLAAVFGWLYLEAARQRTVAEQQRTVADEQKAEAEKALNAAETERTRAQAANDALKDAQVEAFDAAQSATAARDEAERQAASAAARRLATEALYQFENPDELALSGALAALSLSLETTPEAWKALNQAVRLLQPAPEVLPKVHAGPILGVSFSRDGRWMASAAGDSKVVLWNRADPMKRTVFQIQDQISPSNVGLSFSPDGEWLALAGQNSLWVWKTAGTTTLEPIRNQGMVWSVAFSSDSQRLAMVTRVTGRLRLFDRGDDAWTERSVPEPDQGTRALEARFVSPRLLAIVGSRGANGVWLRDLAENSERVLTSSDGSVGDCRALVVSRDTARLVAMCNGGILDAERDGSTYKPLGRLDVPWKYTGSRVLALSDDGRYVASTDNAAAVHVYGDEREREISRMPGPGRSTALAFSPDATVLAVGSSEGTIALWAAGKGAGSIRLERPGGESGVAFSPDRRWLAASGKDGRVTLFDVSDVRNARQIQSQPLGGDLGKPLFNAAGRILVVPSKTVIHVIQTRPWTVLAPIELSGDKPRVAFSPDGRTLVTVDARGIRRFDTATWRQAMPAIPGSFNSIRFSPDSRMIASTASIQPLARRGSIELLQIWSLATGEEVAWQQSGQGGTDGSARAPEGGSPQLRLEAARWPIVDQQSSPAGGDWQIELSHRTVLLSERETERNVGRLEHDADVQDAVLSPTGDWVATSSSNGALRLWPLGAADALERACRLLPRNLTPQEWTAFKVMGPYRKTCPNLP